jgi:hypothetical protein
MTRKYVKKQKVKKGRKTYLQLGKKVFEKILRNKIHELTKTLKFKYQWDMCICEVGIGNTNRLNQRGINS